MPGTARIRTRFRQRWREAQISAYALVHDRAPPVAVYGEPAEGTGVVPAPAQIGTDYVPRDTSGARPASKPITIDPQTLERGITSHFQMEADLADAAILAGLRPLSPTVLDPPFDVAWSEDGTLTVVEVKSATPASLEVQLRLGLGQILRYVELLRERGESVSPVLLVELKPDSTWFTVARNAGVRLLSQSQWQIYLSDAGEFKTRQGTQWSLALELSSSLVRMTGEPIA
jgi:hypothetical protein